MEFLLLLLGKDIIKPTFTRERKNNLTRKRKTIKILIQQGKRKQYKILKYSILP